MQVTVCRTEHFNAAHRLHNPAWDDARKTFVGALQKHGVPCRVAVVGNGNGKPSDHATWISTEAITSGQEVAL